MRAWIASLVIVSLVALILAQDDIPLLKGGRRGLPSFGGRAVDAALLRNRQDSVSRRLRRGFDKLTEEEKAAIKEKAERWRERRVEKINPDGDTLEEVNAHAQVAQDLFQGDMVLTDDQLDSVLPDEDDENDELVRAKRQAYKTSQYPNNLWGKTPIPYTFDSTLSTAATTVIKKAIDFWQNKTCIRFVQSGTGANRINFFKAGKESNFAKETSATNYNYDLPYDLGSNMQYSAYSFAKDTSIPTVVAKEAGYQNTMGHLLPTFNDVYMMNQHYQCYCKAVKGNINEGSAACPSPPTCQNGGVVDVNACSKCFCPQGYGGNLCQSKVAGCGAEIAVDATSRNYSIPVVGNGQTAPVDDFSECNYLFTAPAGKKVKFTIRQIGYVCSSGCTYSGIEIRVKADKRNSGYRYCCATDVGTTVTSESNVVPVHIFNRYYYAGATLEYSAV